MISLCWARPSRIWSLGVHHTRSERVGHPLWEAGRVAGGHQSREERRRDDGLCVKRLWKAERKGVVKKTGTAEGRWVFPHRLWSLVSPQSRNHSSGVFVLKLAVDLKLVYLTQKMSWCLVTPVINDADIQMYSLPVGDFKCPKVLSDTASQRRMFRHLLVFIHV